MRKVLLWTSLSVFFLVLLKTAVFSHISFFNIHFELILFIIVYVSISNGSMIGMLCAFLAGLFLDFLSMAPLGLHSFIFTLLAYLIGKFNGIYNMNKFLLPSFLGAVSFLFKVFILYFLNFIFGNNIFVYDIFNTEFLIQFIANVLFCPLVFLFLSLFPSAFIVKENSVV